MPRIPSSGKPAIFAHGITRYSLCKVCAGSGVVDDGEIDCYSNGEPFENGPIKCVKECPACHGEPSADLPEIAGERELVEPDVDALRSLGAI